MWCACVADVIAQDVAIAPLTSQAPSSSSADPAATAASNSSSGAAAGAAQDARQRRPAVIPDPATSLVEEFRHLEGLNFTAGQQAAVDTIRNARTGLFVMSGGPGTGKTFTTQKLAAMFTAQRRPVLLTASTGAAAVRLSKHATTCHSAFGLPAGRCLRGSHSWYQLRDLDIVRAELLRRTDVIIIDEFSMLSSRLLGLILGRLYRAGNYSSIANMLEHKLVILVGDHSQVSSSANGRHLVTLTHMLAILLLLLSR